MSSDDTLETGPAHAPSSAELRDLAERAATPVFWPLRLQRRLARPGLAGSLIAVAFLLLAWVAVGGWRADALQPGLVGEALFFALSLGLIVELAALIPRAAQKDLDVLAGELTVDPPLLDRLRAAVVSYPARDVAVNALIGLAFGVLHVVLTGSGQAVLSGDPVAGVMALGTLALWAMMMQTGPLLVANARVFASLGRSAARVEPLVLDRLRPFATAAMRPMFLVMVLLAAYPLMLLGAGALTATAAIGPVATACLALAAVWLPLRGLRQRIIAARGLHLARLDAAIAAALRAGDRFGAPAEPQRLEALIVLRNRLQATASLPIGLGGLGRALLYLALPVATWGGKGFAEALLNWLF